MKKFWIIIFLVFSLFLFAEKPYVLMVSFDGFRHDYTDKTATPNFDYLAEHGTKAASIQSVFPSKTFPNHYSIATGAYAGTHGLVANRFYSPVFNEIYQIGDSTKVRDAKWYGSEPIWVTAERQNVKTASYFWVGSEAPIKGIMASIVKNYDHDFPYEARVDSVFKWFSLPEAERPQLVLLYFDQPDSDGHKLGPNNPELLKTIEYMDGILGKILAGIQSLSIADELNLILLSDHGMTEVGKDQFIDLKKYLPEIIDLYPFAGGPVTQLILKEKNKDQIDELDAILKNIPHLQAYKFDELPARFHFQNPNTGDFVLVAEEGWHISENGRPYSHAATHGYDPALKNMQGIFYAMGPNIKVNYEIDTFENVNVYPFICELLEIEPYKSDIDGPDGKLEVLEGILKK